MSRYKIILLNFLIGFASIIAYSSWSWLLWKIGFMAGCLVIIHIFNKMDGYWVWKRVILTQSFYTFSSKIIYFQKGLVNWNWFAAAFYTKKQHFPFLYFPSLRRLLYWRPETLPQIYQNWKLFPLVLGCKKRNIHPLFKAKLKGSEGEG